MPEMWRGKEILSMTLIQMEMFDLIMRGLFILLRHALSSDDIYVVALEKDYRNFVKSRI